MARPPVVNASPLIFLAGGRCFELLQVAGGTVHVPLTVASEVRRRGQADPTVQAMEGTEWLRVVDDVPVPGLIQSWELGPGESAVLALRTRVPQPWRSSTTWPPDAVLRCWGFRFAARCPWYWQPSSAALSRRPDQCSIEWSRPGCTCPTDFSTKRCG